MSERIEFYVSVNIRSS